MNKPVLSVQAGRAIEAMCRLFHVHADDSIRRLPRAVIARNAATVALIAITECTYTEASAITGFYIQRNAPPQIAADADVYSGFVDLAKIWSVVEAVTGRTKKDVWSGSRDRRTIAARALSRVLMRSFLSFSGPEIAKETGHKDGYDGDVKSQDRIVGALAKLDEKESL